MNKNIRNTILALSLISLFACAKTPSESSSQIIEESSSIIEETSSSLIAESSSSSSSSSSKIVSSLPVISGPLQLKNDNGMVVNFAKKGARIESLYIDNKLVGQNGFIAGRVANRIKGGSFTLNGTTYNINKNEGSNTLHGGSRGFGEVDWTVKELTGESIVFSYLSPDGDMGFPGEMNVEVKYTLNNDGDLTYEISATSDKDTIFNPINHMYMNLNGNTTVSNHSLWIDADQYLSVDGSKLPTGELKSVAERSSMDYRVKKTYEKGNDRCLVLNGEGYRKVAELSGSTTGYTMELYTDRVALQLYDDGQRICLEAQDYIDAIHHDNFPSILLKANTEWYSKSAYCFRK